MAQNRPKLSILRSREGGTRRAMRKAGDLWRGSLGLRALWAVLFLVLGTWSLMPGGFFFAPRARAGVIAGQDYVAPHDLLLPDEESTRAKQGRSRDAVLPVYDLDPGLQVERDQGLETLFSRGRQLLGKGSEGTRTRESVEALQAELTNPGEGQGPSGLKLTPEEAGLLVRKRFSADLEDRLRGIVAQVLRRGIVANKPLLLENRLRGIVLRNLTTRAEKVQLDLFNHLGYPDELRDSLETEVRAVTGLSAADRRILVDLLFDNLQPNLHLNRSETLARREAAAGGAGQVFTQISKGQVIVRKGDQINATAARVISQMRGDRRLGHQLPPVLGTLLLLSLAALVLWLGLKDEKIADHGRERAFGETLLLLLLSLLGAKFFLLVAGALSASFAEPPFNSFQSWVYAVPFASLALLAALLFTRNTALVLSFLFPLLISRAVEGDAQWVILYGTAGSLAAVLALDCYQLKQRLVMMRIGAMVGLINAVMVLVLAGLSGNLDRGPFELGFDLLCGFGSGLLVAAVASFAVPVLESLLSITTDIKLIELSNTNLPLLRRLAFEAPGTFQHSLMVANLAKEGCEAIDADSVLAYTGGLYHDVGKIFRPDYFIENQRPGQNRHDKLLPSMSALILINHVKEGLELAREHNLPQPVKDAVEQHHGTRLIKYFYNRALETSDPATGEVREEKYRYPGPKPQNRVMGVLMLADGIEAASRTLVEPTPSKIRTLIRTIAEDCLRDGQLDETDLTLKDLSRISEAFFRVLANIFHQRIDYPGFDFNAEPGRERRVAVASGPAASSAGAAKAS
ncbi:MAG: cyclic-di-AMP phosphodiesterase PgpH [Acidobacteriota bacterium]|nr:cyclic-di-AMP phosphodiesterase PgpH [Acidobacteriota bacterium]